MSREPRGPRCPGGCGRRRRENQLLCRTCWFRLPARLRSPLFAQWRDAQRRARSAAGDPQAVALAQRAYEGSLRVAVAWLKNPTAAAFGGQA